MSKRGKKRVTIGVDETNNGFFLDSPDFSKSRDSPLIVIAYLDQGNPRFTAQPQQYISARRRRFFARQTEIEQVLNIGSAFIDRNPDFCYTTVPYYQLKEGIYPKIRAEAIALLTFKLVSSYDLIPSQTSVLVDEIDGGENSDCVKQFLQAMFESEGLDLKVRIKRKTRRKMNPTIKKADAIGYYIAAIKFLGQGENWPYEDRRVSLCRLEDVAAEMHMKREEFLFHILPANQKELIHCL